MKQKTLLVLIAVLIIALLGLGNYLYQQRGQQMQNVQQNQQSSQKQIADLNDRLVAVARQQQTNMPANNTNNGFMSMQLSQSQQVQLGQERRELRQLQRQWSLTALQLTQDYLRQANYEKAQHLLLQLQQNIIESQSTIADPFNNTLLQTLKIDQLNISQEAQRQRQHRSGLDQTLAPLQQQLNLMSVQAPNSLLNPSSAQDKNSVLSKAWFKQLFLLQPADANTSQHMLDRSFICKQASLNVAMARLALASNSQVGFSSNITEAIGQLNLLADPNALQIGQQLKKLKNAKLPMNVELTSLTLLSGQKSAS